MIVGFEKLSLCDWPGKMCSIIYIAGCNYRCPTCHNWNIAFFPTRHNPLDFNKVKKQVEANLAWLDGIVITGGEPTVRASTLYITKELSKILPIKIDTNGSDVRVIKELLPYTTLFDVDVKGPLEKYKELTYSNDVEIDRVLQLAKKYPEKFKFRTTLVPQLTESDIEVTIAYVADFGFNLTLQPYQDNGVYNAAID